MLLPSRGVLPRLGLNALKRRVREATLDTVGLCRGRVLNATVWEDHPLARSNQAIHIEPDQRVCDADSEISFRGQPHLLGVFAAEEISDPKRERAPASCD